MEIIIEDLSGHCKEQSAQVYHTWHAVMTAAYFEPVNNYAKHPFLAKYLNQLTQQEM